MKFIEVKGDIRGRDKAEHAILNKDFICEIYVGEINDAWRAKIHFSGSEGMCGLKFDTEAEALKFVEELTGVKCTPKGVLEHTEIIEHDEV